MRSDRLKKNKKNLIRIALDNFLPKSKKTVLALGAELKANYCVISDRKAYLHYGFDDLKQASNYNAYKRSIIKTIKELNPRPQLITHDLNPQFLSTQLAYEFKNRLLSRSLVLPVQHHYAHVAAAVATFNLKNKKIIGVACDGTGLGDNGRVWGCEFIVGDLRRYQRIGHLNYIPLPGADKAVKQPWRVALSLLFMSYGENLFSLKIPWLKKKRYEIQIILKMIKQGINTPFASSAGRLFDGVAALIGECLDAEFEAQGPIMLEKKAEKVNNNVKRFYKYTVKNNKGCYVIDTRAMITAIVDDLEKGERKEIIAWRFHNTFSDIIVQMCKKARQAFSVNNVVLAGGVFFNKIISDLVQKELTKYGFCVYKPENILLGDSGLSLGQAVVSYVSGSTSKN